MSTNFINKLNKKSDLKFNKNIHDTRLHQIIDQKSLKDYKE